MTIFKNKPTAIFPKKSGWSFLVVLGGRVASVSFRTYHFVAFAFRN